MLPTVRLRFIERVVPALEYGENVGKTVRILQQWWNNQKLTDDGFRPTEGGEWRDVPTEEA
jgi:hypothetical protein